MLVNYTKQTTAYSGEKISSFCCKVTFVLAEKASLVGFTTYFVEPVPSSG